MKGTSKGPKLGLHRIFLKKIVSPVVNFNEHYWESFEGKELSQQLTPLMTAELILLPWELWLFNEEFLTYSKNFFRDYYVIVFDITPFQVDSEDIH